MSALMVAAVVALALPQATPAPPAPPVALEVRIPELEGARADRTCGNKPALAQQAFCVATTMAAMQAQADQYDAAFQAQGWLAADGRDNLTIYVRRRDGGGCDSFQQCCVRHGLTPYPVHVHQRCSRVLLPQPPLPDSSDGSGLHVPDVLRNYG